MSKLRSRWQPLAMLYAGFCVSLYGVDGVVLIDQNRALAGSVTPGDAPGFPVTISQSGSYRLSGNLTVPNVDTSGIEITADNVSIDLNGFSIIGPVVCTGLPVEFCSHPGNGDVAGVYARFQSKNLRVVNGNVHGMGGRGISIGGSSYVEKVLTDSNADSGIVVGSGVVIGNVSTGNGQVGIQTGQPSTVSGNSVSGNQSYGFFIVCPTVMIGNSASLNRVGNVQTVLSGCTFTGNAP